MTYYKSKRIIDGKPPVLVVVDENGKIINKNPNNNELKGLKNEPRNPYDTRRIEHTTNCILCGIDLREASGNPSREYNKEGILTGEWLCNRCYLRGDRLERFRSVIGNRTGNLDPNCSTGKGNRSQKLACVLYGWIDLNKKNNDYNYPLDCYDPKTGSYHQIQGRKYSSKYGFWPFSNLEREHGKIFENMICFCISEDRNTIERIYKFPKEEILFASYISIYNNNSYHWYNKYEITDREELKKANEIWQKTIENN